MKNKEDIDVQSNYHDAENPDTVSMELRHARRIFLVINAVISRYCLVRTMNRAIFQARTLPG